MENGIKKVFTAVTTKYNEDEVNDHVTRCMASSNVENTLKMNCTLMYAWWPYTTSQQHLFVLNLRLAQQVTREG